MTRKSLIIASLAVCSFATVEASIAQVSPSVPLSDKASFDCTKGGSSVAKILCGSRDGATADWDLNSTLWAIAGTNTEAQQKAFDQEQDHWRSWLNNKCSLPPVALTDILQDQQRCVISEFHNRAAKLRSELTGDVLAGSRLSPEQHAQVQESLIAPGLLQSPADGEFGSSTRQAIRNFQEGLGASQNGFLSHEQMNQLRPATPWQPPTPSAGAVGPSFNCMKATYADEYAICSNAELSQLDNIANAAFEYVRRVSGHSFANSIALPLLQARHVCGSDTACIKTRQLATIEAFQALGAPIIRPQIAQPHLGPSIDDTKLPTLIGPVVDEAGILDALAIATLTQKLAALEGQSTDRFVVVTLKSLQGFTIEDVGLRLLNLWHVGQNDKYNGLILVVAPNERKVRIEIGYGLERKLTNATAQAIIDDTVLPRFRANDFSGGVERGVDDVINVLLADGSPSRTKAPEDATKKTLAELEETKLCQQLSGSKAYFAATCVVRGMEQSRQLDGLQDAQTQVERAQAGLDCTPGALSILQKLSERSAATILGSGEISKLMDFTDAITLECKKAANLNLK